MNRDRWVQIEKLFNRVVDCEPGQRVQLLDEAATSDPELRRQVEALLSCYQSAGDRLRAAVREDGGAIGLSLAGKDGETAFIKSTLDCGEPAAGSIIGPYHLLQRIGEGGMGEVWLAEQKQPVRRRVALKLIKAGMDTREVVTRFESERQALALMDHPVIAKVFDAGATSQGRPYFVMEYVAGVPITAYCDKHKLTTRQRLALFVQLCEGVQHAHQKAIIHRDLKPSNILVSEVDGRPMPRIIDFGIAKATSQPFTAETMLTRAGAVVGTPGYMSPEQADSGGEDIDTRADVYSLGVMLYELLVGALPLDLNKLPIDEILRKLREQDAPKPSTKLRSMGAESMTTAQNRGTDPPTLARLLSGDLDAIALKALEKDRSRRYAAPSELAADIGRYLRNEPVIARPASTAYRARKYARRHRVGVAVAAGLLMLLIAFAVAQMFQLRRVTRERDRATRERDRADRITNFMTGMFKVSDPSESRGNKVTAREILDKASKDINIGLANDPELQAQMMDVMGNVYYSLGLYTQAESLLAHALEIRNRILGPDNPDTLNSMNSLGNTWQCEGHYTKAEKMNREVVETRRRTLGPEHLDTLRSMNNLASTLYKEGHYTEATALYRQALEIQRRSLGPAHLNALTTMGNLANALSAEGNNAEAEKLQREALEIERRTLGPDHPHTLMSMSNLAGTLISMGRYDQAELLLEQTRDIQRRVLGPDHPDTGFTTYNLACIAAQRGQHDHALSLLREAIEHGLDPRLASMLGEDPDLSSLHSDPRFQASVAELRHHAAAAVTPH